MPASTLEGRRAISLRYAHSGKGKAAMARYRERNRLANVGREPSEPKRCANCRKVKPAVAFHKNAGMKSGLSTYCVECSREKAVEQRWLRKYGISKADYDRMLEAQGGTCAICGESCTTGQRMAVDHDHNTGIVRGLLCRRCNRALGMFADDAALLERAITYLRRTI